MRLGKHADVDNCRWPYLDSLARIGDGLSGNVYIQAARSFRDHFYDLTAIDGRLASECIRGEP